MPHCLLCCDIFVYYVTNNFNTTFNDNEFIGLSLYKRKNLNFLKAILLKKKKKDQRRVTLHAGREPFFTFTALQLSEGGFGLYLI